MTVRVAEAEAWVDAHGWMLPDDELVGQLLGRFPMLSPDDYARLLERGERLAAAEASGTDPVREDTDPVREADGALVEPEAVAAPSGSASARAHDLILFCDGLEAGGLDEYAHRARDVAREVVELEQSLAGERSLRVALQAERGRWQAIALGYSRLVNEEPGPG